jgi:hypothetical protein
MLHARFTCSSVELRSRIADATQTSGWGDHLLLYYPAASGGLRLPQPASKEAMGPIVFSRFHMRLSEPTIGKKRSSTGELTPCSGASVYCVRVSFFGWWSSPTLRRAVHLVSQLRPIMTSGSKAAPPCSLVKQSAQCQTSSGVEFRAANRAIMVRIGSLEAQLDNRQILIFGQRLRPIHACTR